MRTILASLTLPLLALGCATPAPYEMSAQDAARLDAELEGLVAGEPQNCIPNGRNMRSTIIDERTAIYERGATRYLQSFSGGCPGLGEIGTAMIIEQRGPSLCSGEIVQLVDTSSGIQRGACSFGEFIPYRPAQ